MRKVVDSNFLRSPLLRDYLRKDSRRQAVLTEFILMEQFRSNAELTVGKSLAICAQFPRQVIVLKRSHEILRMSTRDKGLARRLIDVQETTAFPSFCAQLPNAASTSSILRQVRARQADSAAHMASILADAAYLPEIFDRLSKPFNAAELAEIRKRVVLSDSTQGKLIDTAMQESRRLFIATEVEPQFFPPTIGDAINSYPFRYAICLTLLYMRWISDGRQRNRAVEKVRNDIVDANTAAFATYFDGLLTNDTMLRGLHAEARYLLAEFGAYVGGKVVA